MTTSDEPKKPVSLQDLPPVRSRWIGHCFGCGQANPQSLDLRFHHTADGVVCDCTIPVQYTGFEGLVHGGIISTLLDEAAAYALFTRHGKLGVTRELVTRFIKPVYVGTMLRVEAKIVTFNPPDAEVAMAIYDQAGVCLTEGRSTWFFPRLAKVAAMSGLQEETLQKFLDDCQKMD